MTIGEHMPSARDVILKHIDAVNDRDSDADPWAADGVGWTAQRHVRTEEETMVLATAKIGDFDRFWNTFSTKGAEKRKQHGCKGAHVFRDPNESDRVWAIFDWDEAGWQSFTSDPEVPAIFQEAGFTQGPPKSAEFMRQHDA